MIGPGLHSVEPWAIDWLHLSDHWRNGETQQRQCAGPGEFKFFNNPMVCTRMRSPSGKQIAKFGLAQLFIQQCSTVSLLLLLLLGHSVAVCALKQKGESERKWH